MVRYGLMDLAHLRLAAERCRGARGFYGLSFFGENGLSVEEIVAAATRPHRWIRVSTRGRLGEEGFRLRRDGRHNHLVLRFDARPDVDDLRRLVGLFDPPIPNPHPV